MNWARGFFRVWIVFAALWIGGFAIDWFNDKPYFPDRYVSIKSDKSIKIIPTYGDAANALKELESRGQMMSFEISGYPELVYFLPKELDKETAVGKEAIQALAEYTKKYRADETAIYHSNAFSEFIKLGIGIPLALFGFGSAFAWALRGFKRPAAKV